TVVRALNARLPPDVRVLSAEDAPSDFHARFHARAKTYQYRIWNAPVLSPFERRYVWHIPDALDVAAMSDAVRVLEGRHDFAALHAAGEHVASTVREILRTHVHSSSHSALVTIEIRGTGFLRHMVRTIVGSLVDVGRERQSPAWIADVLASRDRSRAGAT